MDPHRSSPGCSDRVAPHACIFTFHRLPDMRIFDRQVRALLRAGYRVTLIGRSDRRPYAGAGVNDIMVPDRAGGVWRRIVTLLRIARYALQTEADVYHFHDPDLLPVGVLVRALRGRPVVYDIHEIYRVKFQLKAQRSPLIARLITAAFARVEDVCAPAHRALLVRLRGVGRALFAAGMPLRADAELRLAGHLRGPRADRRRVGREVA
ncbi:MAG: glycosyltransferase [Phycisphaerales bacterium]|nr:glycosyltransferase [Phycisphaerales bacterium]